MAATAATVSRQEVLSGLMLRTAQRDWKAFGMLYSMTSPQLFGLMLSMTNYSSSCEDLLQEVYLTVWRKAQDYQPDKAAVTTWLSTIARNRTLDWLRSQTAQVDKLITEINEDSLVLACGNPGPEQWTAETLGHSALQSCLERLSAEQRHAILLAYFEGHTHIELADRLHCALGTVKSWVRRGLQSLKVCLQADGGAR